AGQRQAAFQLGDFDHSRPLVIDPTIAVSSYLGGSGSDYIVDMKADPAGNAYVTGYTTSSPFPGAGSGYQKRISGGEDVFVAKVANGGTQLLYSTYLGGKAPRDLGTRVAFDDQGSAYVVGLTQSSDFPVKNAIQPALRDFQDAFLTKLGPNGDSI